MKINIADIIKIQGATKEISILKEDMDIPEAFYSMELCEPLRLTGELEADDGDIYLTGLIEAKLKVRCDRCMCDFIYNIESEVTESFGSGKVGQVVDSQPIVQHTIDLDPTIVETLLVSLPMQTICREDCKGICTVCGQNLNKQSCDCDLEVTDPRLEKLGLLFNTKQDENNKEV